MHLHNYAQLTLKLLKQIWERRNGDINLELVSPCLCYCNQLEEEDCNSCLVMNSCEKGILIWDTSRAINCCFIIDKGVTSLLTLAVYQIVAHYLQCDVCRISLQTYFFLFIEIECDSPASSIIFFMIFFMEAADRSINV